MKPLFARRYWTKRAAIKASVLLVITSSILSLGKPLLTDMVQVEQDHHKGGVHGAENGSKPSDSSNSNDTPEVSVLETKLCYDADSLFVRILGWWEIIFTYVLPLTIMIVLYGKIAFYLRSQSKKYPSNNNGFDKTLQNKMKAIRMLVVIVLVFGLCYFPVNLGNVVALLPDKMQFLKYDSEISQWSKLFASVTLYGSCIANPIIYTFLNAKFRKGFKKLLFCNCIKNIYEKKKQFSQEYSSTEGVHSVSSVCSPDKSTAFPSPDTERTAFKHIQ